MTRKGHKTKHVRQPEPIFDSVGLVWKGWGPLDMSVPRGHSTCPYPGALCLITRSHCYLRIENVEGFVLIAVYLFIYLYACYSHNSKSIKPNRMKFGGMIGYYPGTIWLDFGIEGQGQGHEKVRIFFLP